MYIFILIKRIRLTIVTFQHNVGGKVEKYLVDRKEKRWYNNKAVEREWRVKGKRQEGNDSGLRKESLQKFLESRRKKALDKLVWE